MLFLESVAYPDLDERLVGSSDAPEDLGDDPVLVALRMSLESSGRQPQTLPVFRTSEDFFSGADRLDPDQLLELPAGRTDVSYEPEDRWATD